MARRIRAQTDIRRCVLALPFAIIVLILSPGRSFGWGSTWLGANLERIVDAARWKMGALRGDFGFQLGNLGYDSDIYFGSLRDRVPDYTFSIIPNVHIYLPLKKGIVLDIAETPQYVFFLKTKEERAWNHSFEGRAHFVMDRFYFMAGAGLINARERLNTEVNLYVRRKERNLQGLAFWQLSEGTAFSVLFRFADHDYENPSDSGIDIRQNLNRTERHLNLTAYLLQISRMRVFIDAEYGSYTLGEAQARDRSLRSYGIFGGIEFVPPPEGGGQAPGFQGRVNLGYVRFDLLDPRFKDFEGLVGKYGPFDQSQPLYDTPCPIFSKHSIFRLFGIGILFSDRIWGRNLSGPDSKNDFDL